MVWDFHIYPIKSNVNLTLWKKSQKSSKTIGKCMWFQKKMIQKMLILLQKRPKNDVFDSVLILLGETKKTRFFQKFCHFLKIHEKSRFLRQILEFFVVFLAFFNETNVYAMQRTVETSIFWRNSLYRNPCTGNCSTPVSPVPGFAKVDDL